MVELRLEVPDLPAGDAALDQSAKDEARVTGPIRAKGMPSNQTPARLTPMGAPCAGAANLCHQLADIPGGLARYGVQPRCGGNRQ